ncbi:PAS domain S-box protein [Candidatus Daviesbacteria bacterium]|nr:PAS domain S-box protein [Candidatus Daviesbacteria bacterium]
MPLRLKIAVVIIVAVFSPYLLGLFIPLNLMLSALIAMIATAIAIVFVFWFLKPLDNLIKSAKIFTEGNFNARMDIKTNDEFENVAQSFNLMADKLSKTFQSIEHGQMLAITERDKLNQILASVIDGIIALDFNKNVVFINKVTEELTGYNLSEVYGRSIGQLIHVYSDSEEILSKSYCQQGFNQSARLIGKAGKQTKVNLMSAQADRSSQTPISYILILHDLSREEELEQMKLDFVSMASHELKTPLTSIVGYLSVFLNENRNLPPDNLMLLNKAFTASQQLQTLIANLLNVNKIEKEQLSVSPEPIDYLPIISKALDDLRNQANQKNIVLTMAPLTNSLPKVFADPVRLGEVVTNLLSNAINYTNTGGKVEVSLKISSSEVTTTVSDTGVGIPKEAIPHLFSKFFRVSNKLQPASKGTGLGLYIAKSIIEKQHGKIWVESEVGKGSQFSFTLPVVTQNASMLNGNKFTSYAIQSGTLNY